MVTRFTVSGRHWQALRTAARGHVYQDTTSIVVGVVPQHSVALDLIDLGLIDRDDGVHYRPTGLGEQVLAAGAGKVLVLDTGRRCWQIVEG